MLRQALDYDFASPEGFNNLKPSHPRGLAYLQLSQGREATEEFQKLIDHPRLVFRNAIGALTRLRMDRAQEMAGNPAGALHYYRGVPHPME